MTLFKKYEKVFWGSSPSGYSWEARVFADVGSSAIEEAKTIVDHCSPQKYGPHGTHGYSFLKREYLLNLLLFHYQDYGFFPSGHICITDEWLYEKPISIGWSKWFSFRPRAKGRNYLPGWWIKIPSIKELES
jgi:hypothetical protein